MHMRAGGGNRVRLDLNSPEFLDVFFMLESTELKQVVASLRRLQGLDWAVLYRHKGFRWEAIEHLQGAEWDNGVLASPEPKNSCPGISRR